MTDIFDLDTLTPQVRKVKINGEVIDVYPIRVNDLIKIQTIDQNNISSVIEVLKSIVPKIEEVNPSIEQLTALMEFIVGSDKKKE